MNTTEFTVNNHHGVLQAASIWERQAGFQVIGYCADCHSPDSDESGRADFFAATEGDLFEQFLDHAEGSGS